MTTDKKKLRELAKAVAHTNSTHDDFLRYATAANPQTVIELLDEVEEYQWRDASEWHEDYGDCLFAIFIGQELQGVEWTSPLTIDGPLDQWAYDRAIFKRVSMKTEDVQKLLATKSNPDDAEVVTKRDPKTCNHKFSDRTIPASCMFCGERNVQGVLS